MSTKTAQDTIQRYFDAFNAGDILRMLDCLSDDVAHHVNEGNVRRGKDAFANFCTHMSRCYREELTDMVIFATPDGTRAAAEYIVIGTYLQTDDGLPKAHGQTYRLPAGSFFSLRDGQITRVVTYYNLADWTAQVSG
ncbi:nuclear transport factor 2 family protein [Primorskyibacter aestuariivivens]|uniref:ketosteroid isomerase-related protein n=1 Tax=Primorskyibacter aestuariivivens TaxID=1888912 RepID=UPI002301403E|nr:ketosteroid isomerase-related protein [Primorskyibacter aestuariivivens]MDA7427854.1 nuclear transport factor 2 family protein [Primorskyibacter aestuariivivens]